MVQASKYAKSLISSEMIELFDHRGWIKIDLGLDSFFVRSVFDDMQQARKSAISNNYPARRVYYDHLLNFNLAAIELPYNTRICPQSVMEFFKVARIGSLVCHLMGWESTVNTLARLFTMGDYNYRGSWHRDYQINDKEALAGHSSRSRRSVQAGIFFDHQEGFRILKKEYDRFGPHSIFDPCDNGQLERDISSIRLPVALDASLYDVISASPGTLILFDPYIYHQGSCNGSRLDFHLRFENVMAEKQLSRNSSQDFYVLPHLSSDFDISDLKSVGIPMSPRQNLLRRLANTTNYYLPIFNFAHYLKSRRKISALPRAITADSFSNTVFQAR